MLLFLPDSACSPAHCVCRHAEVWWMFGQCWKEKMLDSHLRAVADARSPGLCGAVAVKPRGPRFFSRSLRIKHLAQDCQNPSCHGGKSRLRGCAAVYWWERETKAHFALIWRTSVCHSVVSSVLLVSQHVYECVLLTDHMRNTLCFGSLVTEQHISCPCMPTAVCPVQLCFLEIKDMEVQRRGMKTWYSNTGKK